MSPRDAEAKRRTEARTETAKTTQMIAPALIPGTRPEMNTPGFWIGIQPYPDRVILNEEEIREFNEAIRNYLKISHDLSSYSSTAAGKDLLAALMRDISSISGKRLYLSGGDGVDRAMMHGIEENMELSKIPPEIRVRFGFVVKSADQRRLPTARRFYPAKFSRNFDMLQGSVLDIATPVAILHTSGDGKWHYVVAPYSEGWVEDDKIGICSFEVMRQYLKNSGFIVVTSTRGDIYLNQTLTVYYDLVKMGARLPMVNEYKAAVVETTIPQKDKDGTCRFVSGYLQKKDVNKGYLSYTPRNIILQAFEFLNDPYGWGDMNGEQDCSSFIRSIFATVGIELPRHSLFQARTGRSAAAFDSKSSTEKRLEAVNRKGVAGITLLGMKGHIMLYLGTVDGVPYAIHAIWSYREKINRVETARVVNRIVVTDLFLGKDTRHGSLLDRLETIRIVEK